MTQNDFIKGISRYSFNPNSTLYTKSTKIVAISSRQGLNIIVNFCDICLYKSFKLTLLTLKDLVPFPTLIDRWGGDAYLGT